VNKKIDMNYMAGFFDGEGCIMFSKPPAKYPHYTSAVVTICQKHFSDSEILLWRFQETFGGNVRTSNVTNGGKPYKSLHWTLCGKEAVEFLYDILPYLVLKREQAEAVICAIQENYSAEDSYFFLQALKKKPAVEIRLEGY